MEKTQLFTECLLQLGWRAAENRRVSQTQLAGKAHWLGSHSEVLGTSGVP